METTQHVKSIHAGRLVIFVWTEEQKDIAVYAFDDPNPHGAAMYKTTMPNRQTSCLPSHSLPCLLLWLLVFFIRTRNSGHHVLPVVSSPALFHFHGSTCILAACWARELDDQDTGTWVTIIWNFNISFNQQKRGNHTHLNDSYAQQWFKAEQSKSNKVEYLTKENATKI
jgi:hypothetical protein